MDTFKKNVQLFCEQSFLTDDVKREAIVCLLLDFIGGLSPADRDGMKKTELEFVQCVEALIANKEMTVRKEFVLSAWAVSFAATFSVGDPEPLKTEVEGLGVPDTVHARNASLSGPLLNLSAQEQIRALLDELNTKRGSNSNEKDLTEEKKIHVESMAEENEQQPMSFEELNKPAKKSPKLIGQLCQDVTELYRLQQEDKDEKGEDTSSGNNSEIEAVQSSSTAKIKPNGRMPGNLTSRQRHDENSTEEETVTDIGKGRTKDLHQISRVANLQRQTSLKNGGQPSASTGKEEDTKARKGEEKSLAQMSDAAPAAVLSCVEGSLELQTGKASTKKMHSEAFPLSSTGMPQLSELKKSEVIAHEKRRARASRTLPMNRDNLFVSNTTTHEGAPVPSSNHHMGGESARASQQEESIPSYRDNSAREYSTKRDRAPSLERANHPRPVKVDRQQNRFDAMTLEGRESFPNIQSLAQAAHLQDLYPYLVPDGAAASLAYLDQAIALRKSEEKYRNAVEACSYYTYGTDLFDFGARNQSTTTFHYPNTAATAFGAVPFMDSVYPSRSELNDLAAEASKQRASAVNSRGSRENTKMPQQFSSSKKEYAEYLMDWVRKRASNVPPARAEHQGPGTASIRDAQHTSPHVSDPDKRHGVFENPRLMPAQRPKPFTVGPSTHPTKQQSKDTKGKKKLDTEGVKDGKKAANGISSPSSEPPQKQRRGRKKRPKDFPKRPLSGYNLFFKDERARILFDESADEEDAATAKVNEDEAEEQNNSEDEHNAEGPDDSNKKKTRKGRPPPHRKLGFEKMAQTISKRWNSLSEEDKAPYLAKAKVEMMRYREQTQEYFRKANLAKEEDAAGGDGGQQQHDEDSDTESEASEC